MLNKNNNNKRKREFSVGDFVRLLIPKIDRQPLDRKYLLCKIIKKYDNEVYQLACKSGIINVAYPATELELLENQDIPELYFTPIKEISIREASRLQNVIIENNNNNDNNTIKTTLINLDNNSNDTQEKYNDIDSGSLNNSKYNPYNRPYKIPPEPTLKLTADNIKAHFSTTERITKLIEYLYNREEELLPRINVIFHNFILSGNN